MRHLITGGAGFIGVNLAESLLNDSDEVTVFDDYSRRGADLNAAWLKKRHPSVKLMKGDVRHDLDVLSSLVEEADVVYHLAGQVAVTTSVIDPRVDFERNLLGTFNVLEAVRQSRKPPVLIYASTNKVYGQMEEIDIDEGARRYAYGGGRVGISEKQQLDFHSPYGCSKGGADQYVTDYARIFGLKTIVFRQSCIYGPRQFGIEDQGWLAWFAIAATLGRPVTVFGTGKQVRDVLHVSDLIELMRHAVERIEVSSGSVYNVGGGPPIHYPCLSRSTCWSRASAGPLSTRSLMPDRGIRRSTSATPERSPRSSRGLLRSTRKLASNSSSHGLSITATSSPTPIDILSNADLAEARSAQTERCDRLLTS